MKRCFGGRCAGQQEPAQGTGPFESGRKNKNLSGVSLGNVRIHPAADALRAGRLAVTFSGGGFLMPYFIGVADQLLRLGVLRPRAGGSPLAGSSSGSLVVACLACGLTPTQMHDSFLHSVSDCRANGSERRLETVVRHQLESTLPLDAHERCSGVITVGVTTLFPRPRTWRVSEFQTREDLIAALMASCHIPRYFNGEFTRRFRGKVAVDGGMTALLPVPKAPHDFLLKVCCFPREHVTRLPIFGRGRALKHLALGISPDAFGPWPHGLRDMLQAALHPGDDAFLQKLLAAGSRDAAAWAESAGLAPQAPRTPSMTGAQVVPADSMPWPPPIAPAAIQKLKPEGADAKAMAIQVVDEAEVEECASAVASRDQAIEGAVPEVADANGEGRMLQPRLTASSVVTRTLTEQSSAPSEVSLPPLSPSSTRGRGELVGGAGGNPEVAKEALVRPAAATASLALAT